MGQIKSIFDGLKQRVDMSDIEVYVKFQSQRAITWLERAVTKSLILAFSKFLYFKRFWYFSNSRVIPNALNL